MVCLFLGFCRRVVAATGVSLLFLFGCVVPFGGLYAFAAGDDDRNAVVSDLFAEHGLHLFAGSGQRHYDADVGGVDAQAGAYLFEASRAGRILASGHAGGEVVRNDDRDVRPLVHGVQQPGHPRVGEGRVADDGQGGVLSGVGCAFGHGDRGAHVDAGVDGMERREPPQRVAADVAEYLGIFIFAGDLCQCRIHVAVAATLAQCGRTGDDDAAGGEGRVRGEPQGRAYAVRSQFPGAGQFARHAAADLNGRRQDAAQGFFDDGLSLLDDEQRLAFRRLTRELPGISTHWRVRAG